VASPTPTPSASPSPSPSPTTSATMLRSTNITLSAALTTIGVRVTGVVTVKTSTGTVARNALVSVTWTLPGGAKQTQTAMTDWNGNATLIVKSSRGTYTLTETDISKTGCMFDKANSVLTKSITK